MAAVAAADEEDEEDEVAGARAAEAPAEALARPGGWELRRVPGPEAEVGGGAVILWNNEPKSPASPPAGWLGATP